MLILLREQVGILSTGEAELGLRDWEILLVLRLLPSTLKCLESPMPSVLF